MADADNYNEEDLFADLYENDETAAPAPVAATVASIPAPQSANTFQEAPGLDFNPGGHDDDNDATYSTEVAPGAPVTNGMSGDEDQMQGIGDFESHQQEQLFGTGIKEDG